MNPSAPFIHRPVMTTIIMVALVVFGAFAYRALPVSELPNVDFPTIMVSASLPGASPETMASTVATPLEREFTAVAGIDSMTSISSTGSTRIVLQFDLSRDIDSAAQDVQTAIAQAAWRLPDDMQNLPTLRKVNPSDYSIIYITFGSDYLPMTQLDEYAQTRIADRLSTLSGVAQVNVFGSQKYAVRVQVNPYKLAARGLSLERLTGAIREANSNLPSGMLDGAVRSYTINTDGQLERAEQFSDLVVSYDNGAPIYLTDVGQVNAGVEDDKRITKFNGHQALVIAIQRQPGANTVDVVRRIRAQLPEMRRQAPAGSYLEVMYDRSEFIAASIQGVQFTLLLAVVLVVGVILMFLRNLRATLISALALPTSLIGTLGAMYLLGYSLNNLSLLALTLAVGFVVDDAIVVQENIVRYLEQGHNRLQAALRGSREIGFTVVSMTVSLVAVFIPILFMGGLIGRLFTEFAVTLGLAVLLSGVVALTLTPMLASRYLSASHEHGRLYHAFEHVFDRMRDGYVAMLAVCVRHWQVTLVFAGLVLLATAWLFVVVPKGFIPSEDTGMIMGRTRAPEGVAFEELVALQDRIAAIVQANPNVAGVMSSAGQGRGGSSGGNVGMLLINLEPRATRADADTVIQQLRQATAEVSGMEVFFQNPAAINIGGRAGGSAYQYVLQGSNLDDLSTTATLLEERLKQAPQLQDVDSDLEINDPQIDVRILRARAATLGVSANQIESALYSAYGGRRISTIYGDTDDYSIILELAPEYQMNINALSALHVASATGHLVPLTAVAAFAPGIGPLSISHYSQLPAITLSFDLTPGVSLGEAADIVNQAADSVLPQSVTGQFAGTAETFQASMVDLPVLLLFTVFVIYMVLAILYEHFIHPLTILTALPLAGFGALLTLLVFKQQLDIFSFAGLILLVGLVKKNGIIMVDFAVHLRRDNGLEATAAIIEACRVRFRPIMMTTLAAILGVLPIALGVGAGAEARRSLGVATVGGLVFSQALTMFVTPAFYVAMERLSNRHRNHADAEQSAHGNSV